MTEHEKYLLENLIDYARKYGKSDGQLSMTLRILADCERAFRLIADETESAELRDYAADKHVEIGRTLRRLC